MNIISAQKVIADCFALAVLVLLVIVFKTSLQPPHRGFFCDDPSIRYPYIPTIVSWTSLVIITLFIPIVLIALVEAAEVLIWERNARIRRYYVFRNIRIHRYAARIYILFGHFLIGLCTNVLFGDVAKFTTGSLRPNFIAVCQPDQDLSKCNSSQYIIGYRCENPNLDEVTHSRLSFYSDYAAHSFYAAVFLFYYLSGRLGREPLSRAVLPIVQSLVLLLAFYISIASLVDHSHHFCDIYVGIIVGSLLAYIVVARIASVFDGQFFAAIGTRSRNMVAALEGGSAGGGGGCGPGIEVKTITPLERERIRQAYAGSSNAAGSQPGPGAGAYPAAGQLGSVAETSIRTPNRRSPPHPHHRHHHGATNFLQNFKKNVLVY